MIKRQKTVSLANDSILVSGIIKPKTDLGLADDTDMYSKYDLIQAERFSISVYSPYFEVRQGPTRVNLRERL